MKPYCFFSHVAFGINPHAHAAPQETANLLIEIDGKTLTSCLEKKRLKVSSDSQRAEMAGEIAMAAAADYFKAQPELGQFPVRRFVNFDLIRPQSYISIRPPPTRVLSNGAKIWRVEESEADKLRGEPRSIRYPDIEQRLAAHPFLKGLSRHHLEILALCATPTEFDVGQTIFLEGDPATGFYLIESGTVVLNGKTRDGETVVIDTVRAGEPLGWSWLFPPYLWSFDARSTEACRAICLSGIMLRQHRDDDATLSHELFRRISEVAVRRLQVARSKLISRQ